MCSTKRAGEATEAGDETAAARVLVRREFLRLQLGAAAGTAEAAAVVEQRDADFQRSRRRAGLCAALRLDA